MNKFQLRSELVNLNESLNYLDSQFTKMKVAYHNLEKMGFNFNDIYQMIDEFGIPFYKLKTATREFIKEQIKNLNKEE